MTFPNDSVQALLGGDWWVRDTSAGLFPGKLIWAHVPFFSQIPYEITATRSDDLEHAEADLNASALKVSGRRSPLPGLPVAGFPRLEGADCFMVQRVKIRPCLVVGGGGTEEVPKSLSKGKANWSTSRHCLVAPFYSADEKSRAGYSPELVERIRHGSFRQFFVDQIPESKTSESILRFDQTFPLGVHSDSYRVAEWCLSGEAFAMTKEWFEWYLTGKVSGDDMLALFFEHIDHLKKSVK
ncbi:MAG: hypothetical protein ACI9TH_002827 [Kiritimatiellia bacterium]|jgi:hypothetical protein